MNMKLGFSTLALFMKENSEIVSIAKKHGFDMIEILREEPITNRDNMEFKESGLDIRIHAATVDINIASLNSGIRRESIRQMIECAHHAEKIGAKTVTIHPGRIGRIDSRIRKYALDILVDSVGEIIDSTDVEISLENMPKRRSFLANTTDELERLQQDTGCYLTIDTGHANTTDSLEEMLELKNISYCHIHDNNGLKDEHNTLGEGTLNLDCLRKIRHGIIEINDFDKVLKSKEVIDNLTLKKGEEFRIHTDNEMKPKRKTT